VSYTLAFLFISSFADRVRGIKSYLTIMPAAVLSGYTLEQNQQIGWDGFWLLFIAYILGEMNGWGNPMGAFLRKDPMANNYHSWQTSRLLRTNIVAALFFRGIMWGIYPTVICLYVGINPIPFLLIPIWFVLSLFLTRAFYEKSRPRIYSVNYLVKNKQFADKLIAKNEWVRGFLFGLGLVIFYGELTL
jgi:hypothetical protein